MCLCLRVFYENRGRNASGKCIPTAWFATCAAWSHSELDASGRPIAASRIPQASGTFALLCPSPSSTSRRFEGRAVALEEHSRTNVNRKLEDPRRMVSEDSQTCCAEVECYFLCESFKQIAARKVPSGKCIPTAWFACRPHGLIASWMQAAGQSQQRLAGMRSCGRHAFMQCGLNLPRRGRSLNPDSRSNS